MRLKTLVENVLYSNSQRSSLPWLPITGVRGAVGGAQNRKGLRWQRHQDRGALAAFPLESWTWNLKMAWNGFKLQRISGHFHTMFVWKYYKTRKKSLRTAQVAHPHLQRGTLVRRAGQRAHQKCHEITGLISRCKFSQTGLLQLQEW